MKKLVAILSIFVIVAFASMVIAQEKPAPAPAPAAPAKEEKPKIEKLSGVIDKIDDAAKTFDIKKKVGKEEKIFTFAVTSDTKITKGKETLTFADLKQKMNVSVEYKKDGDKLVALSVKVAVPKAKAAPKKAEEKKPEEKKPEEAPKK